MRSTTCTANKNLHRKRKQNRRTASDRKTTKTKPQATETKPQETKSQELSVGTNMPNTKYTAARDDMHPTRQANGLAVLSGYRSSRVREQPIYELRVDAHHERDATIFLERL